jgi:hypothetical protein
MDLVAIGSKAPFWTSGPVGLVQFWTAVSPRPQKSRPPRGPPEPCGGGERELTKKPSIACKPISEKNGHFHRISIEQPFLQTGEETKRNHLLQMPTSNQGQAFLWQIERAGANVVVCKSVPTGDLFCVNQQPTTNNRYSLYCCFQGS